jgi:phosphoribosylglycinamide formyltransferase-1
MNFMKIGVLGSGKGSNLQAIIDAKESGKLPIEIALVISDVGDAYILERAKKHGIPSKFVNPGKFKTKLEPDVEKQYVSELKSAGVELVVLAGFMRMLKDDFIKAFPNRVINIHPALLPAFRGLEAWKQAVDYGVRFAGCTVHFLDLGMDTGPIILQAVVPVLQSDTPQALHERIQLEEHRIYPEAIKLFAEGRLKIEGRRVIINNK